MQVNNTTVDPTHDPSGVADLPDVANPMADTADRTLDITRETCPMTFVRTRLALDRMAAGERLLVLLRGDEPARSVPRAAAALGHVVLRQEAAEDGVVRLLLRKAYGAKPVAATQYGRSSRSM